MAQVVLPSEKFLQKCEARAKASRLSLSKWIFETVEASVDQAEAPKPDHDIAKDLEMLQSENRDLRRHLKESENLLERRETELFKLRHESFADPLFRGHREGAEALIEVLRRGGTRSNEDLLRELNVNPKDRDAMQVLLGQLHALQDYGLVAETAKGWRWVR